MVDQGKVEFLYHQAKFTFALCLGFLRIESGGMHSGPAKR